MTKTPCRSDLLALWQERLCGTHLPIILLYEVVPPPLSLLPYPIGWCIVGWPALPKLRLPQSLLFCFVFVSGYFPVLSLDSARILALESLRIDARHMIILLGVSRGLVVQIYCFYRSPPLFHCNHCPIVPFYNSIVLSLVRRSKGRPHSLPLAKLRYFFGPEKI